MSGAKHICIISPGALGSNPRVVKEADALKQAGYRVTVITTRTLDAVDMHDSDILGAASWTSRRLDLRGRRWISFRVMQMFFAICHRLVDSTQLQERAFSAFTTPLASAARAVRADLYIAHYPAALPAAARAAKRHGGRYAYDAEDFHLGDLPMDPIHDPARALIRAVEARYLPGCAYVSAASPGIADAYADAYGITRPQVILNVFPLTEAPTVATSCGTVSPGPSVYWFSQTIGTDRGLECAIEAIAIARSRPHLYLRGSMANGFAEIVNRVASEAGVMERCHILPSEPPSQMARLAQTYDLGFVGETGEIVNRRIALTNKAFTYFLAGIPAVLSDIPAHRLLAKTAGGAVRLYCANDPGSLAVALDDLLSNSDRLAESRRAALALAQNCFNWQLEQQVLLHAVKNSLVTIREQGHG